jgi:hypothetical protein
VLRQACDCHDLFGIPKSITFVIHGKCFPPSKQNFYCLYIPPSLQASQPYIRSRLVEDIGEVALAAILAVVHGGHEDTGTALQDVSFCIQIQRSRLLTVSEGHSRRRRSILPSLSTL